MLKPEKDKALFRSFLDVFPLVFGGGFSCLFPRFLDGLR